MQQGADRLGERQYEQLVVVRGTDERYSHGLLADDDGYSVDDVGGDPVQQEAVQRVQCLGGREYKQVVVDRLHGRHLEPVHFVVVHEFL